MNSAKAGVAAADAQLAKLKIETSEISVPSLAEITEYAHANDIATRYVRWLEDTKPRLAELTKAEAAELVRSKIDQIAATESSRAFNEALIERARDSAEAQNIVLYRRWSALGDACEYCIENDGISVRVDDSYPNGEEPGHVHPNCRCTEEFHA